MLRECCEAHYHADGPPTCLVNNLNDNHICSNAFEGRQIVELSVLAEILRKGCCVCHKHLYLYDCVVERRYGLASLLYIAYKNCYTYIGCLPLKDTT